MRNFLIVVAVVALAWWYFRKNPNVVPTAAETRAAVETNAGAGCLVAAENANRSLAEATRLLTAPPVDTSRWSDAESAVTTAISTGESACSGGATESEREGMLKARDALALMRTTLAEGSKAALGAGGFQGAMRQEAIDNRLDSARSRLR